MLLTEATLSLLKQAPRCLVLSPEIPLAYLQERGISAVEATGQTITETDVFLVAMSPLEELDALVLRLRGPGGCPWDQEQTHESLKSCLLEETYEVFEAIDNQNNTELLEELGDLLLQPLMHAAVSEVFDTNQVTNQVIDKLIRRHPHVFGETQVRNSEEVLQNWNAIKSNEYAHRKSVLDGIPKHLPALYRALKISKKAVKQGFEWPDYEGVLDKIQEELSELKEAKTQEEKSSELGDLFFTLVNWARWNNIDPEEALQTMLKRFTERFQTMERLATKPLTELTFEEWDSLWLEAKKLTSQKA